MKKIFILAAIIMAVILIMVFYRSGKPIDVVSEVREGIAKNIEVIDNVETENGVMIYSIGESNTEKNYMYSVDLVKKSLTGYKWLGGGGHVNQDVPITNEFIFSLQLLNEEQNVNPTLFGVLKDLSIENVNVSTHSELIDANFYEARDGEMFYVIPFSSDVASSDYFQITITFENNSSITHIISNDDEISRLQEGKAFYLSKKDFK
ncbi:hypothetical protein [Saliterribacillus persicus]|uniref:Uncharacterized protein n=1 Tax=Saliterribacillus persicus TaxID=930114 RepID=A0A368XFI5_9BACI|nr:hypothetical protein [Saliterribacillus persicus]RCW65788.1 hypothetical protein DFR57_1102 [Saliterribacillus persicus]